MLPDLKSRTKAVVLLAVLGALVIPLDALPQKRLSLNSHDSSPLSLAAKSLNNATGNLKQPADTVTETSYENWFSRLGDAFWSLLIGLVLIVFSIPCMWINERRAARFESLITVGEDDCMDVGFDKVKEDCRGCLIHVSGTNAEGKKPLQDDRFKSFRFDSKCLRISSSVEAYQWVQHEKKEKRRDSVGGGETTVTTYSYTKEWKSEKIDSSSFKQGGHNNSLAKTDLALGLQTKTCSLVHYGEAFQLPEEMVMQLTQFQDASSIVGTAAEDFTKSGDYYYYPEERGGQPNIGDMRASFTYIPDGPATAVGLQYEDPKLQRDSFLPYRLVSRGACCWKVTDEQLKKLQIKEGLKSSDDLYADDKLSCGPLNLCFYCCVGVCNIVTYIFSGLTPPQIFHLFPGDLSVSSCWSNIKTEADMKKWGLRLVAWLMMLIGLMAVFQPVFTVIDIIPFLGTYLSDFLWFAVFICAFIVTLSISTLVISFAYLVYRPLLGLFYLVCAAACIAVPIMIINATKG